MEEPAKQRELHQRIAMIAGGAPTASCNTMRGKYGEDDGVESGVLDPSDKSRDRSPPGS